MMLCLLHHVTERFFLKQRRYLAEKPSAGLVFLLAVSQQINQPFQFQRRPVIADFHILQRHIYNENDLLSEMIKGNHFIKQHHIHIFK